jgi:aminopeptidase
MQKQAQKSGREFVFSKYPDEDSQLARAAAVAVNEVLEVREGERVLIVTNPSPDVSLISQALYRAAAEAGAVAAAVYQPVKTQVDFSDPAVTAAIATAPDVVVSMSAEKIGKDEEHIKNPLKADGKTYNHIYHYLLDGVKRIRSFWSPGINIDYFKTTVPVDYKRMKEECRRVGEFLDRAESIHITNPNGTDIRFGVHGRKAFVDDGDFSKPGLGGNLPAGESFISPALGTAEGTIVFDGSISVYNGVIVLDNPITARVSGGFVTKVEGKSAAEEFEASLRIGEEKARQFEKEGIIPKGEGDAYARNARNLGELGIGLNPAATIVGNMLVDEKVYKTCHIAVGSNYDDDAEALIHLDGLITEPTIEIEDAAGKGETILDKGNLQI